MQEASNLAQEIYRFHHQLVFRGDRRPRILALASDRLQPHRGLVIAQSTRRLLYVGLQVVNSVSVSRQSILGQPMQLREQEWPCLPLGARQNLGVQPFEKTAIPGKESPIKQRQVKFRIVLFYAFTFVDRSSGGANAKSQVPQHAGKFSDHRTEFRFGCLVAKKKENIEVGVGKQKSPPITAERQ